MEPSHLFVDHKIFERISEEGGFVKRFSLKGASVMLVVPTIYLLPASKFSERVWWVSLYLGGCRLVSDSCPRKQKQHMAAEIMRPSLLEFFETKDA